MKGIDGIPALRLEVLNKYITKVEDAKDLFFVNLFPSQDYASDTIRWILEYDGMAGMTPFVSPGSPAPVLGQDDWVYGEGSARAAFWKEKVFLDETMLNNLREPMSDQKYWTAERQLTRKNNKLIARSRKRKEWMIAKMFFDGQFSYQIQGGAKFTVNYAVPSAHQVVLSGNDRWWTGTAVGTTSDPMRDIIDWLEIYKDDVGSDPQYTLMSQKLLNELMFNGNLQELLKKSTFGEGDLFKAPKRVLKALLGIAGELTIYDETFDLTSWLSADLAAAATDIYVENALDFEAGAKLRIWNTTESTSIYEDLVIASVDAANDKIVVSTGPTKAYKAGQSRVVMKKRYLDTGTISMFRTDIDGETVAEFMNAPFGNNRQWGQKEDRKEEWDPEGVWLRVQNKGLPVLYQPECTFTAKVADF